MTSYRDQLENALKTARFKLEDAARKGSVNAIAEAQINVEKVEAALAGAKD